MKERNAIFLLFAASFIWGMAFVCQSQAAEVKGPFMYNGLRMPLGALVLSPLVYRILKKKDARYKKNLLKKGLVCGILLGSACYLQQFGIAYTTAGKAGFITSLYAIMVPVFSIFMGKRVSKRLWLCVLVGLCGLFLLSINGDNGIGKGDILIFCCAILYAVHVMYLDKVGGEFNGVDLSCAQFAYAGIICLVLGLLFEPFHISMAKDAAIPLLYSGICSCGWAYTFQVVGQKYGQPTKATLALCLESAWAAVGGIILLGERMNPREWVGCILLFGAVVIAQLPEKASR
ncbi:MAG: DMT family transporter [Spirochaetales bacterium]|nr:DMT family transporter [Candidatus Physcosoma equi]